MGLSRFVTCCDVTKSGKGDQTINPVDRLFFMLLGYVSITKGHGQGLVTEYILHILQVCASHQLAKVCVLKVMEPEIIELGLFQGFLE